MDRTKIINQIGIQYHKSNIEGGEYSYVKAAGGKENLSKLLGYEPEHYKLDIRFYDEITHTVILVETKQEFKDEDENQLKEYLDEEKALNPTNKVIGILANTTVNDKIKVWKGFIDKEHLLNDETVIDSMSHYIKLFNLDQQNNREAVLRNTYALNELLHKMDIPEKLRSQFVGTSLLYVKDMIFKSGVSYINENLIKTFNSHWNMMSEQGIRSEIKNTLDSLLDGSANKAKKIELLQKNVLEHQKIKNLKLEERINVLDKIIVDIYRYINTDSSEGQDILNLFFIAFNKYTGKEDKNQAFTPDHITEFMCRVTNVDRTKVILDGTCGSGSFLVQAMIKEFADCRRGNTEAEAKKLMNIVKEKHIYGIENEDIAYGLSTTNMLIHGDGNSNISYSSIFDSEEFIMEADPDIILMNPPYNAKPKGIPDYFKVNWTKKKKDGKEDYGKEDQTKGLVFIKYLSDVIKKLNSQKEKQGKPTKTVTCAVLLPVSVAIGSNNVISSMKKEMLEDNTLDAVFTLPNEVFYPGASASACCMVFTLGKPHKNQDGTVNETFFGYYKDDGFRKKKKLGRIEQFDINGHSKRKEIEDEWLKLYRNKIVVDGKSAKSVVSGDDERLCEAYMKTDYSNLSEKDFQKTINNYLAYLVSNGDVFES